MKAQIIKHIHTGTHARTSSTALLTTITINSKTMKPREVKKLMINDTEPPLFSERIETGKQKEPKQNKTNHTSAEFFLPFYMYIFIFALFW